jgi:MFS family permease
MTWKQFTEILGLRRSIVGTLSMVILIGMGEKMADRFLPIYLVALGSGLALPGALNALNNFVEALYAYPGGWLAERLGEKGALLIFNLLSIAGYALVIAVPRWESVIIGSFLFLSWSSLSLPATMGIVSKVLPKQKHVMGVSVNALVRRIPMALGPIVGGVFIDRWGPIEGVRLAFIAAIVMAALALVLQQALIMGDDNRSPKSSGANPIRTFKAFSADLKKLFLADVLIRFCEHIPYAYVVIWCMGSVPGFDTAHVTATQFGILTAIEMATAVVCYLPVAHFADQGNKRIFVIITFINFALFPLVLFFSRTYGALVVAFIIRGLKEFGEPTRKALILELAPEQRKSESFGVYYLFRDSLVAVGAFAGAFLWKIGPAANLLFAFMFGVAGAAWFGLAANRDKVCNN